MTATKFPSGRIVLSRNALVKLDDNDVEVGMARHLSGDWGNVDKLFGRINDLCLTCHLPLSSSYESSHGVKFWIVTEADRSETSVLLPEDF